MPNKLNSIPYFRRWFSRRHCIRLGMSPHFIHFRKIFTMAANMEKHEENLLLDYEPAEEEVEDSLSGAEETELRFGDLNLEEEEMTSVKPGNTAIPETSGTGGACALPTTPTTTQEKEDLDPKLSTMVTELVRSQVRQALEASNTRLGAAEREILTLREEQLRDQNKLLNLEAKEARRKEKRKERKERSRTQEAGPVPEKRTRTSLSGTSSRPSQEEPPSF